MRKPSNRRKRDTQGPGDTFVIERLDQLKALAHPLRQQLFERFAAEPATTKQVATQLSQKPTRLYHHVATLEKAGLIQVVKTRQIRGTTEKYYSSVARSLRVDSSMLSGSRSDGAAENARLGVVESILQNVRDELAELLMSNDTAGKQDEAFFAQAEIRGSPEKIEAIRDRVTRFINELGQETDTDDDEQQAAYRLVLGWYPGAGKKN